MGYAFCIGNCFVCHKQFTFNPVKVPSFRINGVLQPVCRDCIDQANPIRVKRGLPAFNYSPDAYEACDENEL